MPTFDDFRNRFPSLKEASDEEIIKRTSELLKLPITDVAFDFGYDLSGGKTSQRFGASFDQYQAGLYGTGEALAEGVGLKGTSDWLAAQRKRNEAQAEISTARAKELGAVESFKEARETGEYGNWLGGLAIQSAPYAAEALVGGLGARAAMTGTRAALTAAEATGDLAAAAKANRALNIGSTVGGTAASYPSSVGDVLNNQREQSPTGETRGGVAAALGVPYAALNAVGIESAIMRGNLFKNSVNLLDRGTGFTGAAARTAATATGTALKEGASETGQEMINQLGRMSVDKNEQFFSDAAQERFKESFIGGAALGGVAGGTLGGWRRSGNDVSQAISSGDQTNPPITTQQFTPPAPLPPAPSAEIMAGLTGRGADPLAGRSKLIGGEPAPAPTPPAVSGGSTDIAQAQQQAQIESQQIQKAQAQQAAREQIYTNFGIADPTNPTKGNLFGKPLFGPSVPAVADAIGAATRTMSAYQLEVAQAINKANAETGGKLLSFQFNANDPTKSVQKAIEAVGKVANAFQISHVQTVEEAAQILNEQSNTLKGAKLEQLNAIHQALTGEDTSGYLAEQQSKTAKGAKNVQQPKLQTTTGLGTVPVQDGTREGGGGNLGNVQPSGVQSLLTGSQPQGPTGQQIGQPSGEGIRTGTSVTPDLSDDKSKALEEINNLLQQVFGGTRPEGAFDETENTTEAGTSGGQPSQSEQAKEPTVVTATSEGNGGPRKYEIPAQYYNTDLMHIRPQRRQQIINEVLEGALTPEVDRENTVSQEDRVAIVRMSLLEDMTAPDIALELGLETDTVDQQRRRLGIRLGTYGLEINQSIEAGRKFMASLMLSAENFRSPEFPDGIGVKEFAGLYSAKDLYYDKGKFQHVGTPVEEETEQPAVTTDVKLQEELKNKPESEAATQSAGQIKTAGGSQGNVDSLKKSRKDKNTGEQVLDIGALDQITNLEAEADRIRDALEDMAPKDPRRAALTDRLDAIGDVDSGELGALWGQYAKAQAMRNKAAQAQGVKVDKEKEEAAEVTAPTELTGEEIAASEREDERRKEAAEKEQADQGEEDAIQEQGADEGDVRQPAGSGEKVGKTNAKPKKSAGARKAKVEVKPAEKAKQEVKTPEEQWKALADQFPGMPPYEGLTKDEKIRWDDVASRGVANLAAANTVLTTTVKAGTTQAPSATGTSEEIEGKFGKDGAVTEPYSVAELTKEISDFVRTAINTRRLKIVGSVKDLLMSADPVEQKLGAVLALNRAYGVATNGRAYLIADRIGKGQGRAKFMHEVGVHLGVEGLLPDKQFDTLTDQIFTWAKRDDDSREAKLAKKAILRAETAGTPDEDLRSEILAYFVEEAMQDGINPSAAEKLSGPLGSWFRTLWAAFKTAIRRLGMNPEKMDAQDVVNLAYGAARLEMSGTYHGTAADFRRFNHRYMGSGEGAQAYGWGTYLAQRFGIAKGYWKADVRRKEDVDPNKGNPVTRFFGLSPLAKPEGNVMRVDIGVDQNELLNWDGKLSKQPELLAKLEANIPEGLKQSLVDETNLDLNEMTGEDLYRGLEFLEKKEGRVSEEFNVDDYNKRLANKKAKELVSVYLDEVVGIPGLKFYDAESRGKPENEIVFNGKRYSRTDLIDMRRDDGSNMPLEQITILRHLLRHGFDETMKELEQKLERNIQRSMEVKKDVYAKYNTPYVESEARKDAEKYNERSYEALQIKFLNENKDNISVAKAKDTRTRNLVIFNDKNIFRVGSRGGNERANMKFGIDAVLPAAATKPAKSVVTNIATAARNGLLGAAITEDVVNMAGKYMRSAKDYLAAQYARQKTRLEFEMRIERILEDFDKLPKNLQGTGAGSVNRYILDSTMQRKWGYYPGEERIGTQLFEADPDLAARFNAFPDDAQQLIKDVFEHGYTALDMKKTAVSKAVEREFAEREKAAIGDVDALADLQKERKAMVAKLSRLQNIDFTVPYAYLGRYGDYIVVAKSKEFKHWQERAELNDFDVKQAKAWLSDNSSNPDHYVVQFAETQGEADQLAAELIATGKFDMDGTEAGPKEAAASYIGDDLHLAVSRARNLANRQKGEGSEELDKLLGDLYLMTAAENSARKSEIARKYVYGANENMMRNLATSGRADAHFLSTMEHNDAITESLENMRNEARRNYKEAMPLYNELYTRQANSMDYKQPALLSQALTQATSLWFLSTSPAFYLQQILQTGVLSLPYMAGRLGYFRSARAIKTAYGDVAGLVKGLGVSEHVDFSKAPADVRGMLQTLVGMGKIDIGIDSDARSRAGEQGTLGKVVRKLQGVNNRIETINRATAAIAAYRGYLQRFGANNTEAATKFAAEVVSNSHGSYDGFNTPRVLASDIGRVVGQFKRFQIIQLSMLAKLIHTSFKGASAEEKMVARRALAFITGHMAVLGGALGVPFVMQIGNLLTNLFGDDDEPKDFEYKLRQAIGDKALADLLLNGVPAAMGVNLGGKLGMGNVASILPFTDVDLSSRSGYEKVMVGMMGPFFGGLAPKFIDGAGMITQGEYYKGLELLMPNGIGNAMKGVRYATEGITMRNGDVVMQPEDISIVDAAFQAVGLPTTTITGRQYTQKTKVEFDKFYADKAAEIKGAYVDANRDGDSAGMADARTDWENLQASRRRNGYKIQPMSELFMAVTAASKRQRSVVNGVETTKANKQFVANII